MPENYTGPRKHLAYFSYVMRHKWWVLLAGLRLGASPLLLLAHDKSKFSRREWTGYADYFFGRARFQEQRARWLMERVFRIQDAAGRGPYRPGMSSRWADPAHATPTVRPPTWLWEFGYGPLLRLKPGHHMGCGFRTMDQLRAWFTPSERQRMHAFGYRTVSIDVDEVLAESENQLVFGRAKPLRKGCRIIDATEENG